MDKECTCGLGVWGLGYVFDGNLYFARDFCEEKWSHIRICCPQRTWCLLPRQEQSQPPNKPLDPQQHHYCINDIGTASLQKSLHPFCLHQRRVPHIALKYPCNPPPPPRQEVRHLSECLGWFLGGSQMFPPPLAAKGVVTRQLGGMRGPKAQKWTHMLPSMLNIIEEKLLQGWAVAFLDGSKDCRQNVDYAGFGVWFAYDDDRNEFSLLPMGERQSITLVELRGALRALQKRCLGILLHVLTGSELVFLELKGNCDKWKRRKWVGSCGPLSHTDFWVQLWDSWLLLGDGVGVPWVPSHVGVEENERAD